MNDMATRSLVHESEVQRQYPRVRLNGFISIQAGDSQISCELINISSGGVGFKVTDSELEAGATYTARIITAFAGVEYRINTSIVIVHIDSESHLAGAMFDDLGVRERSAIQLIINSYVSGELLEPEDMINGSKRDNFVTPRKKKKSDDPGKLGPKAFFGTAIYSLAGILACYLVLYQIYDHYLVDRSTTANLSINTVEMTMPRDAVFTSLIPEGETRVAKGQPLASYTVSAMSLINDRAINDPDVIENLDKLISQDFTTTLFSPCDCLIKEVGALDGTVVNRGKTIFQLIPDHQEVMVMAKFRFQDSAHLENNKNVVLEVVGENTTINGTISEFKMAQAALDAEGTRGVDVWIKPEEALPIEWVNRPVQVKVSRVDVSFMGWL
ncbi:PilZ domain-containing protein [Endozoicomonas arenosclerae]|uniref:PilZ domain-containing protein n=1 Tax=Endozoicomonas arenosclerae TaxID=1633495 RepID=UPI000785FDE7|nr:PilZ domain-containing protein [Endozoicomonas arenosclerae]